MLKLNIFLYLVLENFPTLWFPQDSNSVLKFGEVYSVGEHH